MNDISGRVSFFSVFERMVCELVINALFILVVTQKASILKARWLYFMGAISYPLYLIHESFGITLSKYFTTYLNKSLCSIMGILISVGLAALITFYFERPIHSWLKNLYFKRSKPSLIVSNDR